MAAPAPPLLDPLIERYLSELRVEGGLALNTLEAYRRDLAKLQSYLAQHGLRMGAAISPSLAIGFLSALKQEGLAATSIARAMSAMRGWFRFLLRERLIETNPMRDLAK